MPPLIAVVVKTARVLFGDSLSSIRFFAAVAGAGSIVLTGRLARELGGGRFAQGFAALTLLVASACLSMCHYISMNSFEPLLWTALALVVVRIVNTGDQKLWLWAGLIAGIGLNNKYSMAFLCAGIVVGLLLTPERRAFLKPWIWLAGAITFVLVLPNLIWNVQHHFPFLELMANIRRVGRNPVFTPLEFLGLQVQFAQPANLPVWLGGLCWYLFGREGRRYRASLTIFCPSIPCCWLRGRWHSNGGRRVPRCNGREPQPPRYSWSSAQVACRSRCRCFRRRRTCDIPRSCISLRRRWCAAISARCRHFSPISLDGRR